MSDLFGKDVRTISEHIGNVYREKELERNPTIRKFRIVQKEGKRLIERQVEYHNLDVIISVGYRVKSKRGTQFRIWATNVLRDHLVKGYTFYQKRLQESKARMKELEEAVELVRSAQDNRHLSATEASGLLNVITEYARSWLLLQRYDEDELPVKELNKGVVYELSEEEARKVIDGLREDLKRKREAGDFFGRENAQGHSGDCLVIFPSHHLPDNCPKPRNCGGAGRNSLAVRSIPPQLDRSLRSGSNSGGGISAHLSSIIGVRRVTYGVFLSQRLIRLWRKFRNVFFGYFLFKKKVTPRRAIADQWFNQ